MSIRVNAYTNGVRAWSRWRARRTLDRLRRTGRIAGEPVLVGLPDLQITGSLRLGRDVTIVSEPVQTHIVVYAGGAVDIADGVRIGFGCGFASYAAITVGADTRIGNQVLLLDSDYHVAGDPSAEPEVTPIAIGAGVTIGDRSIILRGAQIGDGAIVDPASVVSGVIAPGAHVAGVPAREVVLGGRIVPAGSVETEVLAVARRVFGLAATPQPGDGPDAIARWNSLGALSFLLALEDAFGIVLDVDRAGRVASLRDVAILVSTTLDPRATAA